MPPRCSLPAYAIVTDELEPFGIRCGVALFTTGAGGVALTFTGAGPDGSEMVTVRPWWINATRT